MPVELTPAAEKVIDQGKHGERVTCLPTMTDQENSDLARRISAERRASGPGFLPDLQIDMPRGMIHVSDGKCQANPAQDKVEQLKHGSQKAEDVISQVHKIQDPKLQQDVIHEIQHNPNDFPNVNVIRKGGGAPSADAPVDLVPFDGKKQAEVNKSLNKDFAEAGKRLEQEAADNLQKLRDHPEQYAHRLEEMAKKATGGDAQAESEYRHAIEDMKKLPPDVQQKIADAMVKDPTVETKARAFDITQDPGGKHEVTVRTDQTYEQQADTARVEHMHHLRELASSSSTPEGQVRVNQEINDREAGRISMLPANEKRWFDY